MRFWKTLCSTTITVPFLIGLCSLTLGAAMGASWTRSEIIPVVLVKPGIFGFEPAEGSSIGNTWTKAEVKPVLLVKPGIFGFEPREGTAIGNTWSKAQVLPVMLVEPSYAGFTPLESLSRTAGPTDDVSPTSPGEAKTGKDAGSTLPAVIESQIDGDFEGWDGETVVKLTNGQIWQQSEYHYTYHYAFMPKVLIYRSSAGYKMKVDGVEKAIGVTRLK